MTAHLYPLGTDISIKTGRGWANVIGISFNTFNLYILNPGCPSFQTSTGQSQVIKEQINII